MDEIELKINIYLFKIDKKRRKSLWRKLSRMLLNGVSILDSLTSLYQRQISSGRGNSPMAIALKNWIFQLKNGKRLSQAIDGWVDKDEQMIIAAGDQSGNLEKSMVATIEIMDAKKRISSAIASGIAYPLIALSIAFSVLFLFSFKIIPEFSKIVPYEKWTGIAKVMIDFSNFSRDWILLILAVVMAIIVAFFASLPHWSEGLRIKLDKYPPYSVYRMLNGSTWMISFATLVASGVRVENALEKLAEGTKPWMYKRIQSCLVGMRSGLNPGDALFKAGYGFPDMEIIDDLSVYARLSGFDSALDIIGREWMTESVEQIQALMKVIFGVSILCVGMFIAFMVGGLIGMEMQLASIMQGSYH